MWGLNGGRIPIIAVHAYESGTKDALRWADVAAGKYDDVLTANTIDLKTELDARPGSKAILVWDHEPEDDSDTVPLGGRTRNGPSGMPTDYIASFEHVRTLWRTIIPRDQAPICCTLMGTTYRAVGTDQRGNPRTRGDGTTLEDWLPTRLTMLGVDDYNAYPLWGPPPWKSFEELFAAAYNAATVLRKRPLLIEETGCVEDPNNPEAKARWFTDAKATLTRWKSVWGVEYSHVMGERVNKTTGNLDDLPYWIDTSSQSLTAYRAFVS